MRIWPGQLGQGRPIALQLQAPSAAHHLRREGVNPRCLTNALNGPPRQRYPAARRTCPASLRVHAHAMQPPPQCHAMPCPPSLPRPRSRPQGERRVFAQPPPRALTTSARTQVCACTEADATLNGRGWGSECVDTQSRAQWAPRRVPRRVARFGRVMSRRPSRSMPSGAIPSPAQRSHLLSHPSGATVESNRGDRAQRARSVQQKKHVKENVQRRAHGRGRACPRASIHIQAWAPSFFTPPFSLLLLHASFFAPPFSRLLFRACSCASVRLSATLAQLPQGEGARAREGRRHMRTWAKWRRQVRA